MEDLVAAHDPAAKGLADRLVAEADSQDRQVLGSLADQLEADAGARRVAGARRKDDRVGAEAERLLGRHLVVAHDARLGAELAQVMHQVPGEAVVVVDEEQHRSRCFARRVGRQALGAPKRLRL